jgi:hypothetical protein
VTLENAYHVVPNHDLVEHDTTGGDCMCGPDVHFMDPDEPSEPLFAPMIVHHSLDGREELEEADGATG